MQKKYILPALFLCCLPGLVLAAGKKEKELIIPSDAGWVMGIKLARCLETGIGNKVVNSLVTGILPGVKSAGSEELNRELDKTLSVQLNQISEVTGFGLSGLAAGETLNPGLVIKLQELKPEQVIGRLQEKYGHEQSEYRKIVYYSFRPEEQIILICPLNERLLVANTATVMEKMLDVLAGSDDIANNKPLFTMIEQYKQNMIYAVGYIPEVLRTAPEADFLSQVQSFGLSLNLSDRINGKLSLNAVTPDEAANLASFIKLSLALATQMIPEQYGKLREIVRQLLSPIKIKAEKSTVIMDAEYPEADLTALQQLLPQLSRSLGQFIK